MKKTSKLLISLMIIGIILFLNNSNVKAGVEILSIPQNVKASVSGVTNAKIKWDKIEGVKKYTIYRATSAKGKYKKVGTSKTNSFINKSLTRGTTYYYKVAANGENKLSKKSNYAKVKILTKKQVLKKIRNALKDKKWVKNNVKMKYSVFDSKIEGKQTLYFGKLKNKELVAIEAVSESDYSVQMFLVGYKNGKVIATSSTEKPMHCFHGGPSIDLNKGIAAIGSLSHGYLYEEYFKVSNVKFTELDTFEDNEGAMDYDTYFRLNGKKVSKKKYKKVLNKYLKYKISSLQFNGYKLTSKNIDRYIK